MKEELLPHLGRGHQAGALLGFLARPAGKGDDGLGVFAAAGGGGGPVHKDLNSELSKGDDGLGILLPHGSGGPGFEGLNSEIGKGDDGSGTFESVCGGGPVHTDSVGEGSWRIDDLGVSTYLNSATFSRSGDGIEGFIEASNDRDAQCIVGDGSFVFPASVGDGVPFEVHSDEVDQGSGDRSFPLRDRGGMPVRAGHYSGYSKGDDNRGFSSAPGGGGPALEGLNSENTDESQFKRKGVRRRLFAKTT